MAWRICSFARLKVSPPTPAETSHQIVYKYSRVAKQFYFFISPSVYIRSSSHASEYWAPLVLVYYHSWFLLCSSTFFGSSCGRTLSLGSEVTNLKLRALSITYKIPRFLVDLNITCSFQFTALDSRVQSLFVNNYELVYRMRVPIKVL